MRLATTSKKVQYIISKFMNVFEEYALEYDEWFEINKWVYLSEVEAVRKFIPEAAEVLK